MRLVLALLLPLALGSASPARVHDIRDHGALPDGTTLSTAAVNSAVIAAAAEGGGTVRIPAGRFLSGTIYLLSNVTLQLEAGAVLLGSTELKDYPENPAPEPVDTPEFKRIRHLYPGNLEFGRHSLIYAAGQDNVAVIGPGLIDGQGDHPNFTKSVLVARGLTRNQAHFRRPYGLGFVRCTNVRVQDVAFRNMAFWCQSYLDCDGVQVTGVTINSRHNDRNNDGIDLDGCRNVRVSDCHFNTGDDSICLKASYRDCENIVITNSVCNSLANGVKFGTASNGGFRNIAISNLTMEHVSAAGLALEVVDGGTLDGVVISNIVMNQVGAAIFIRLGDRGARWMQPADHAVGALRNVSISNVVAQVFTPYDGRPLASSISGLPGHPVEHISLSNIRILSLRDQPRSLTAGLATADVPEQPGDYPEYSMFGSLPAYGLYVRHARDVTLDNVWVGFARQDHRSSLVVDDAEDLQVRGWTAQTLPGADPVLRFKDVRRAAITGTVAPRETGNFLKVEGRSTDITIFGSDLTAARQPVELAPGVAEVNVRR